MNPENEKSGALNLKPDEKREASLEKKELAPKELLEKTKDDFLVASEDLSVQIEQDKATIDSGTKYGMETSVKLNMIGKEREQLLSTFNEEVNSVPILKEKIDTISLDELEGDTMELKRASLELRQLREVNHIANDFMREYLEPLKINIPKINDKNINWNDIWGGPLASHSYENNSVRFSKFSKIEGAYSLHVIIHEQLHYLASAKNSDMGKKALEGSTAPVERISKTGFNSNWEEDNKRSNLRALNEAVTEKMAYEIYNASKKKLIEEYENKYGHTILLKQELDKEQMESELTKWKDEAPVAYEWEYEYSMNTDKETFENFYTKKEKSIKEKYEAIRERDLDKVFTEDIESGYKQERQILDRLLIKLAEARSKENNIDLKEAHKKEWEDLQKAYLSGNTFYLRKIDKIVGEGTLRRFNDIDRKKIQSGEETQEQFNDKVKTFLSTLENKE